jgi:membrane fusion protein (multidrug efflux system)
VRERDVLVELESKVERAQLESARARLSLAGVQLERSRALFDSRSIAKSQLDADQSAFDASAAEARAYEAQIARKTVRAPFSGLLGIRAVNVGQYLEPGTMITSLETIESVFVDFTLPQQELASVREGMPVRIALEGSSEPLGDGKIIALDPQVDPVTRSIKARATIPNEGERLRPGMFVNVSVVLPEEAKVVIIPVTAIVHAAYGDSVFVADDKKGPDGSPVVGPGGQPVKVVRQQFVRLGERRGDFVGVREGLTPGQEVIVAGAFKLRSGMSVVVTPDVKPAPELRPHPENR